MRKSLHTLQVSGMSVRDVGSLLLFTCWENASTHDLTESTLDNTNVNGFPIISSGGVLVGYIGRTELRYVLGKLSTNLIWIRLIY